MIRLAQLPWGLAALLAALCVPAAASPSVNVAMKAAFPSPPYLVELLETAAPDNATRYYALLDRIAKGDFADVKTDKALYEKFLEVLDKDGHMDDEALSIFKLKLAMRTAAPRIEAHYQYYTTAVESAIPDDPEGCEHWFLYDGKQYCAPVLDNERGPVKNNSQERVLPFDRVVGAGSGSQDLILYADITSRTFGPFHDFALKKALLGEGSYRVRYKRSPTHPVDALDVNGYGVELALKRTDYIVIDDRATSQESLPNDAQQPLASDLVLDPEEEVKDIKPLEKSELSSLGMKAAAFIMQSDSPFEALLKLTQDFPKYSTSLGSQNVSEEFEAEHLALNSQIPSGANILFMNGIQLIDRQVQPFGLIDTLQRERRLIHGSLELGLTGQEAVSLFGHSEVLQGKAESEEPVRYDWRDEIEEGRVIVWLNNIEKDSRYENWSPALWSILQMGGGLPRVRRDIFNLIVPVDFSKLEDLEIVLERLLTFMKNMVPVRFGLVPLLPTPEAAEQAKVVYYLLENYGLKAMSQYLQASFDSKKTAKPDEAIFNMATKGNPQREEATTLAFSDIFEHEHYEQQLQHAKHWLERLHAGGPVPSVFFNGFGFPRDETWFRTMNQMLNKDLQMVQRSVYFGQITDEMWVPEFFLEGATSRRNSFVFPDDPRAMTVLDVHKVYTEHSTLFASLPAIEADKRSPKDTWAALTVIADLDSDEGKKLLFNALQFRRENSGIRLDVVHNPVELSHSPSEVNQRVRMRQDSLVTVTRMDDLDTILQSGRTEPNSEWDAALVHFLQQSNIQAGHNMLILNGRVIGPIKLAGDFKEEDFEIFLDAELAARISPVLKALEDLKLSERLAGPVDLAKLSSVTALSGISDLPQGIFESVSTSRTTIYNEWNGTHSSFAVGDAAKATIHLVAVLNPASDLGQKWAAILKVLSDLEGVHLRVFLNPKNGLSELPVKRFYRYVLDSAPTFDDEGKVNSLSATFSGVPSDTLLIAGMDVPPAWLVSSKVSVDDLDNLRIKDIKARRNTDNVEAIYELEHILIEGHSREVPSGTPPRGVQLALATEQEAISDTIIMANLGFFQFKANPGVYNIQLKEGRSSEIFKIDSVGPSGWSPSPGDGVTEVALMDFQGSTLYPRLSRNPDKEEEDVLEEKQANGAMDYLNKGFKFAGGLLGGKTQSASDIEHAEINIFSVASGHLYERMLNIMMVSVMKHTKHTVKFWFIEQFLSPSFKDFIPVMAAEYGFKYEMVTYKWPHWLRQQKEKQREIWGYKILFLDVLFPLSLDKVIFVDADQIVRTDMYDLVQLDLEGAVYGFTPMCDSRTEMEGFRFWKTGYWETYLKGKPYHISALYVVDLRRFRELAAGDRLRQTYHQLSADPASLSNLDQDLPNHMQFTIPIHSLPQEWLWCETWCSDETLSSARTIDLCNNPQTKEPKLDRARRQVPEWTVYDEEIAALDRRRKGISDDAPEEKVLVGETQDLKNKDGKGAAVDSAEAKNPKSRRLDDEEAVAKAKTTHVKEEL